MRHITAASLNITPDVTKEELAWFRAQVSNPANVQEFLERWEREEGDVEEGLGEEEKGENDGSDNLEIVIRLAMVRSGPDRGLFWRLLKMPDCTVPKKVGLDWTVPKRLYSPMLITFLFRYRIF